MDDTADPSNGWPVLEVQQTSWIAPRDWYGKLYVHIHGVMKRFLCRLQESRIRFDLYNVDVRELPQHLERNKFSRIEVCPRIDKVSTG